MISNAQSKLVRSLHQKKYRQEEGLFIAEGEKVVNDLIASGWKVKFLFGTDEYLAKNKEHLASLKDAVVVEAGEKELEKISALTTAPPVLAVAYIPNDVTPINYDAGLKLVLDEIKDPGNLGALLRIADWFGITEVICSENCVDAFNPKVVQGAMGSLFHLDVHFVNLEDVFRKNASAKKLPVYGTLLEGENIFEAKLSADGFIVMGNESIGISAGVKPFITHALRIPDFSKGVNGKPESLNVSVAAGIVCALFKK